MKFKKGNDFKPSRTFPLHSYTYIMYITANITETSISPGPGFLNGNKSNVKNSGNLCRRLEILHNVPNYNGVISVSSSPGAS